MSNVRLMSATLCLLAAAMASAKDDQAQPAKQQSPRGDWVLFLDKNNIHGLRLDDAGMGKIVAGNAKGSTVASTIKGKTWTLRIGDKTTTYNITAASPIAVGGKSKDTSVFMLRRSLLQMLKMKQRLEEMEKKRQAQLTVDKESAKLLGTWNMTVSAGPVKDEQMHFDNTGAYLLIRNEKSSVDGGRFHVKEGKLTLRWGKWLDKSVTVNLQELKPGKSMKMSWVQDGETKVEEYEFVGKEHPLGKADAMTNPNMVGKWLFTNGKKRWVWDFRLNGRVYRDQGTEYVADRYSVKGDTLTVKSVYRTYNFRIAKFERGKAFEMKEPTGPNSVFAYVEGPHRPPHPSTKPPTGKAAILERQRMLAEHRRIMSGINMQNQATRQQSQMVKGIAHDIADTPTILRWEWNE